LQTEVLHREKGIIAVIFFCCDFDVNKVIVINKLDLISPQTKNEVYTSRLLKVIMLQTYRQTNRRQQNITALLPRGNKPDDKETEDKRNKGK